jgi:hypothetical protein
MKYTRNANNIVLNQDNPNFKEFITEDDKFEIECKRLTTKEKFELADKAEQAESKGGNISIFEFITETFYTVIVGWKGLKTEDGEEIKFSEKTKKELADNFFEFVAAIVTAYNEEVDKKK